jgi:hypothetical protein
MKVTEIDTLHCDAGWRNYSFVKLTTDEGIVGHKSGDHDRLASDQVGQHSEYWY